MDSPLRVITRNYITWELADDSICPSPQKKKFDKYAMFVFKAGIVSLCLLDKGKGKVARSQQRPLTAL